MSPEYDASWSLNRAGGTEQAASGLNARAVDFVKCAYGQVIYVCPEKNLILARFGCEEGKLDYGWQATFRLFSEKIE